jgi:phosphoribosylpyrophosphate synthetase
MSSHPLHIFSGSRFVQLAEEITSELDLQLGNATSTFLPDSEIHVILLEHPLAIMHKRRDDFSSTRVTHIGGEVAGKRPIIIDDLISGGNILKQLNIL